MNIELDEIVVQDVSDDALEQAAGGAQLGRGDNYLPNASLNLTTANRNGGRCA